MSPRTKIWLMNFSLKQQYQMFLFALLTLWLTGEVREESSWRNWQNQVRLGTDIQTVQGHTVQRSVPFFRVLVLFIVNIVILRVLETSNMERKNGPNNSVVLGNVLPWLC